MMESSPNIPTTGISGAFCTSDKGKNFTCTLRLYDRVINSAFDKTIKNVSAIEPGRSITAKIEISEGIISVGLKTPGHGGSVLRYGYMLLPDEEGGLILKYKSSSELSKDLAEIVKRNAGMKDKYLQALKERIGVDLRKTMEESE